MENEKPEIELYMYSLNQEFPVGVGRSTFMQYDSEVFYDVTGKLIGVERVASRNYKSMGFEDWGQWNRNYTYYPATGLQKDGNPLENIIMRQEDFGGILFDRINDRIYKVNVAGYKLFKEILEASKKKKLAEFRSKEFEPEDIEHFITFLKEAGLWSI